MQTAPQRAGTVETMSDDVEISEGISPQTIRYLQERAANIQRSSDKLRKAMNEVASYFEGIYKTSGLTVSDEHPFYQEEDPDPWYPDATKNYYLKQGPNGIEIVEFAWDPNADDYYQADRMQFYWCARKLLKKAVVRLPKFIPQIVEEHEKADKELADLAEKAAKIAAVLSE